MVKRQRIFLLLQSVLCVALALLLAGAAIGIYREGLAEKAENPLAQIYTAERIAAHLRPLLPLIILTAGAAITGAALRVRDEKGLGPVKGGKVPPRPAFAGERILRCVLILAALALLAAGVLNGSARDVLGKAIKICTECVGLG